jgi:hypothetical protein
MAHVVEHMLFRHCGTVCGCVAVQAMLHLPQLVVLVVVSTHVIPQSIGADIGHPDWHAKPPGLPADGAHSGVLPEHVVPQVPQLGLADRSVAQPAPASAQSAWPAAHRYVHVPPTHASPAALTLGNAVQSWPQAPQLWTSLLVFPQPASIATSPVASAPESAVVPESAVIVLSSGASFVPVSIAV